MLALHAGTHLGNYELVRALGSGGMGAVYEARHLTLGRRVAIKVLHAHVAVAGSTGSDVASARFLREGRAAAQVRHPHVVDVFDFGVHEGTPFLVMELIDGETLAQRLTRDGPLPLATLAEILLPVLSAVAELHAAGIVHRDLKPANILLSHERSREVCPKVADFGVSRLDDGSVGVTESGAVLGTFAYMAPEQARASKDATERSDQYALGVILYECATGVRPFPEGSAFELLHAIMSEPLTPPSAKKPGLPQSFDAMVLRAMSRDPESRFTCVEELGEALLAFAEPSVVAKWASEFRPSVSTEASGGGSIQATQASGALPPRVDTTAPAATGGRPPRAMIVKSAGVVLVVMLAVGAWRLSPRVGPVAAPLPSASAIVAPNGCRANAECTQRAGAPSLCVSQACVAIESQDCHAKADPSTLASEDTVWIGSLYPLTGPSAEMGRANERGTDLARQDFAQAASGLKSGARAARPLGLVSCDDGADPKRAARHLVEDLHVPAILGFRDGNELVDLAGSVLGPSHVLALPTLTTSPLVTQLPRASSDGPSVWRISYSLAEAAPALSKVIETILEPDLHKRGIARIRVATVRPKTPGQLAFSERLFGALHYNGKSALDNAADYREFVFDGDADASDAYESSLARLRDFEPNVIVYSGTDAIVHRVLVPLEKTWPQTAAVRPRYLNVSSFGEEVAMVGHDADLRSRIHGLTLFSTTRVNALFTMHYDDAYHTDVSRADAPSTSYDGFYVAAYATFALPPGAPATGPALARAIAKLIPPGAPLDVGPSGIYEAFTRLGAGESIDLVGAGGTLDFDMRTGEHEADLSILCLDVDKHGNAVGSVESGLVYSARENGLVGKMRCP